MNERLTKLFGFLEKKPTDTFILFAIANEFKASQNWIDAINYFEKVLEIDAEYTGVYLHLGLSYYECKNIEKAIAIMQAGLLVCKKKNAKKDASELLAAIEELMESYD